jgi:hypothetical protein
MRTSFMSIVAALNIRNCAARVIALAAEHRATTVLIEDAGPGMNLLQDLRASMPRGMTRPIGVRDRLTAYEPWVDDA